MPIYKDDERGTWFVKVNYTDMFGKRCQKKKRGFRTKREALEWERAFALKSAGTTDMLFKDFVDLYIDDIKNRIKPQTLYTKTLYINHHILPFFGDLKLNEIEPLHVRKWQNDHLLQYKTNKGELLTNSTLRTIQGYLSSIFNYAIKLYNLPYNPLSKVGYISIPENKKMIVWTPEDFKRFIKVVDDKMDYCIFNTLYFTGMRIGEALALQVKDIDLKNKTITVNKTAYYIGSKCYINAPKTPKSNRTIAINNRLVNILDDFIKSLYGSNDDTYIFNVTRGYIAKRLRNYIKYAGVAPISLHGFRHSHASLLIELGFAPTAIADRLGHENVTTTLNIYSHMFPSKQSEIADKLDKLF